VDDSNAGLAVDGMVGHRLKIPRPDDLLRLLFRRIEATISLASESNHHDSPLLSVGIGSEDPLVVFSTRGTQSAWSSRDRP
jgi:hypothetical protein